MGAEVRVPTPMKSRLCIGMTCIAVGAEGRGAVDAKLVAHGWFLERHPPMAMQCFRQNLRSQSGAIRDCPQPLTGHVLLLVGGGMLLAREVSCSDGVGDFDDPGFHRIVRQSSPFSSGPWH